MNLTRLLGLGRRRTQAWAALGLVSAISIGCGTSHTGPGPTAGAGSAGTGAAGNAGVGSAGSGASGSGVSGVSGGWSGVSGGVSGSGAGTGAGGTGAPGGAPLDVLLQNRGQSPVLLGGNCGQAWPSFSRNGEVIATDSLCGCSCSEYQGACGCLAFCPITAELLFPGEDTSYRWDGYERATTSLGCYELEGFERGDMLTASACFDLYFEGDQSFIECAETDFAYGVDNEAIITIEPEAKQPIATPLTLTNMSSKPITIITDSCGSQAVFELKGTAEQNMSMNAFCPCSCAEDWKTSICPACGACADDVTQTLAPGESYTTTWDGNFFYHYDSGCSQRYAMPRGFPVEMNVCYTKEGESQSTCMAYGALNLGFAQTFNIYD